MRRTLTAVVVTVVVCTLAPLAGAAPECFGRRITHRVPAGGAPFAGTPGNDVIWGTSETDRIDGAGGNDRICARGGGDRVEGGLGRDRISGGSGDDQITGDVETDGVADGGHPDLIHGGAGWDNIVGDSYGRTTVTGGADDVIDAGRGGGTVVGDSQVVTAISGVNITVTGQGDDKIRRAGFFVVGDSWAHATSGNASAIGAGDDRIEVLPVDRFVGTPTITGDSRAEGGSGAVASTDGDGGADTIIGAAIREVIAGDHFVKMPFGQSFGAGDDRVRSGDGDDLIFGDSTDGTATVSTAGGADDLQAGRGDDDEIYAGPENDTMDGGPGSADACHGEDGTDTAQRCESTTSAP